MIVDLNLKGRQVVVIGAGKEAVRKVESLIHEDCEVIVIAESVVDVIQRLATEKKIILRIAHLVDGKFLDEFDRLILVMAATNNIELNRVVAMQAREKGCYAYSVDDPLHSDFSYPATFSLYDTIQISVSTGGRSPLMAGKIREIIEPVMKDLVKSEDSLQVHLQSRLRDIVKQKLPTPGARKQYLRAMLADKEICQLLSQDKLKEAEAMALKKLEHFQLRSSAEC